MIKSRENEKNKFSKNIIYQKQIKFESNKTYSYPDISQNDKYNCLKDQNINNTPIYNTIQNINNQIYKKPSINANINNQSLEESKNNYKNINNNIINEIRQNIKQNESRLENMNKTMQELFAKKNNDEYNISKESKEYKEYKEYYTQINDLEKIKQENLTLKSDSIIYHEDIMHLSEINKKLKLELDLAQKKIFDLITKGENINEILTKKNYEINLLTEDITKIKLANSGEMREKIRNNKTKEQKIFENEFELNCLNNEKIKLETEIKNLEEKYNELLYEKNKKEKEDEFYQNQINENISGLYTKIKKLEMHMDELSNINKELKLNNQKYEKSINILTNEKNIFYDKYTQKQTQFNQLKNEFRQLEDKYSQILYDTHKMNFEEENEKTQENNNIRQKKRKSSKQIIVNDLYNKIQEIKENIKTERNFYNN